MRRFASAALLAGFALGLAACTPAPGSDAIGTSSQPATSQPAPSPATTTEPEATPLSAAAATAGETFDQAYLSKAGGGAFPSLDLPRLVAADEAEWLEDTDIVLGVGANVGDPQAYPAMQMAYHHIANTSVVGEPYLVTY